MIEIKTERLHMMNIDVNDFTQFALLESRIESFLYESGDPLSLEQSKAVLDKFIMNGKTFPSSGSVMLSIKNEQDLFVGIISIKCNWEEMSEWEIGYKLLKEFWGHGYITDAVKAVATYLFDQIHIHKLVAFANSENVRSEHVLQRVGMKKEGHLREARIVDGEYKDEVVYAMLRRDLR
jgi:RimJ/RimL family protein N-acetyltransferase